MSNDRLTEYIRRGVQDGEISVNDARIALLPTARIAELEQALWCCAGTAGEDLDGQTTPAALKHPDVGVFALNAVTSLREDYDKALDELNSMQRVVEAARKAADVYGVSKNLANALRALDEQEKP